MTNIDMIRAEQVRIREAELQKAWAANCGVRAMTAEAEVIAEITRQRDEWRRACQAAIDQMSEARQRETAVTSERDMLARRVSDLVVQLAEANRYIRDRLDMDAEDESANGANGDVFSAIAVHQSQGVR